MTATLAPGSIAPPPDPPELPEAARPRWPPWYGPVALVASLVAVTGATVPLLPVLLLADTGDTVSAMALLLFLLVQDGLLMGAALIFAATRLRPRAWHFGIRATRPWRTAGWAALGFALIMGFETGYIALVHTPESNIEELKGVLPAIWLALAYIVVAPVSEEFFFRGFFYRALRTRLGVLSAALIDGLVFGVLHWGSQPAVYLPVIAVFGVGQCLIYERTGSLFAVIAVHAAFNTVATISIQPVVALVVGAATIAACVWVPRVVGSGPTPFGLSPRARPLPT